MYYHPIYLPLFSLKTESFCQQRMTHLKTGDKSHNDPISATAILQNELKRCCECISVCERLKKRLFSGVIWKDTNIGTAMATEMTLH